MRPATLPNHHRFTGAYRPPMRHENVLGICPCGCKEEVSDGFVYVVCEDEYFVDRDHFMRYMGAEEIG